VPFMGHLLVDNSMDCICGKQDLFLAKVEGGLIRR
jgi:hypothetical protein